MGFAVVTSAATRSSQRFPFPAVPEGLDHNGKPVHASEFLAVRFDGVLEVTDAAKFLETVRQGIGSAKGFGFGLLSLARVS